MLPAMTEVCIEQLEGAPRPLQGKEMLPSIDTEGMRRIRKSCLALGSNSKADASKALLFHSDSQTLATFVLISLNALN